MNEDIATAETSVLGGILIDNRVMLEVSDILRPPDFERPVHEEMFAAMLQMAEDGTPIDALTLNDKMSTSEMLRRAGGFVYLHDLVSRTPTATNAEFYARIVAEDAGRRRLHAACVRGAQLTDRQVESGMTSSEMLEVVRAEVDASTRARATVSFLMDTVPEYLASLDDPVAGYPTPWASLNYYIGGWVPGRLYVLGARPGVGKSLMGFQAATEVARQTCVSLSSLEMSRGEVTARILANKADVSIAHLQNHTVTPDERLRLNAAAQELSGYRLAIDDRTNVQPIDVGSHARSVARRGPLGMVVVDYMQLMGTPAGMTNRQEAVSEMSRQLKLLARSLEVPVLALSQLNRGPAGRENNLPAMTDLRESGAIEQDADVVILMSMAMEKDEQTGEQWESRHLTKVQVAKNRHGETGIFDLYREGEFARLRQPARQDQVPA